MHELTFNVSNRVTVSGNSTVEHFAHALSHRATDIKRVYLSIGMLIQIRVNRQSESEPE